MALGAMSLSPHLRLLRWSLVSAVAAVIAACTAGTPIGTPAPATLHPQTVDKAQAAGTATLASTHGTSLSLAVVDRSYVLLTQSFGVADPATGAAPTTDTMYGIGSISKMFAAAAVMKLVDQGKVALDAPVVTYLPSFAMRSPQYRDVTVRMLLNHGNGFPGTDQRGVFTSAPNLSYAQDLLGALRFEPLKFTPGYLEVYTNDGFTLVEDLVAAVSGEAYVDFVQNEIFTPLGMAHTRFPTSDFPPESFAHSAVGGPSDPQEFCNTYGSGGIYSTPTDMGRFAQMFLNGGALGATRVLSEGAVRAMAVDQTQGTFDPVPSAAFTFGLGWDTVTQPALATVGLPGWSKGGDTQVYGSSLLIAPSQGLAAVVMGVTGISSTAANDVAEQILLTELAARGSTSQVPPPLPNTPPPPAMATPAQLQTMTGYWARSEAVVRVQPTPDGALALSTWNGSDWQPAPTTLRLRTDGWFAPDASATSFREVSAGGRDYLAQRAVSGYGEYVDQQAFAQRVTATRPLSPAWRARLGRTWLVVNQLPDWMTWALPFDPRLTMTEASGLEGLIVLTLPQSFGTAPPDVGGSPGSGAGQAPAKEALFQVVDPSQDDESARMMLLIPTLAGRDLDEVDILRRGDEEWLRLGALVYRPSETMPAVARATGANVTIGPEGYAEWRALQPGSTAATLTITTGGAWQLFGADFTMTDAGTGNATVAVPAGANAYVLLYGNPGDTASVALSR